MRTVHGTNSRGTNSQWYEKSRHLLWWAVSQAEISFYCMEMDYPGGRSEWSWSAALRMRSENVAQLVTKSPIM